MDKYVIREARVGANYPQGNQMMTFTTNVERNKINPPEAVYYDAPYANQFTTMHHVPNSSYADPGQMNAPVFGQNVCSTDVAARMNLIDREMHPAQGQMMTGIDPRYLANYSDNSAQYIVTGQISQGETGHVTSDPVFGSNYQNYSFTGVEKNKPKSFTQGFSNAPRPTIGHNVIYDGRPNTVVQSMQAERRDTRQQIPIKGQMLQSETSHVTNDPIFGSNYQNSSFTRIENNKYKSPRPITAHNVIYDDRLNTVQSMQAERRDPMQHIPTKAATKVVQTNVPKKEQQNLIMSRAERLQALHKSGPRAFSGPVEKVLKWHKALQDIGIFVFYEIVAKCVSVRPGETCSKNLVIRDENGPAMQVVYYEIDFLLPELKVPSTVRVIGRMMAGTSRLQAFSVRPATGDDVATLPRRAAVAAHHVAKLCKEYGMNV